MHFICLVYPNMKLYLMHDSVHHSVYHSVHHNVLHCVHYSVHNSVHHSLYHSVHHGLQCTPAYEWARCAAAHRCHSACDLVVANYERVRSLNTARVRIVNKCKHACNRHTAHTS